MQMLETGVLPKSVYAEDFDWSEFGHITSDVLV